MQIAIGRLFWAAALAVLWCSSAAARDFHVAVSGTAAGTGSRDAPWDLETAFSHPAAVRPGDTVWLEAGSYSLRRTLRSRLRGVLGRPILVRARPGARVAFDCAPLARRRPGAVCVELGGAHTWYWGFEISNSDPTRRAERAGAGADPRGIGVLGRTGPGVRLINLVIHDVGVALFESASSGFEIYGLIAYNSGWEGPDRSHGPGLYMRNRPTAPPKWIEDSIVFQNYRQGLQGYGTGPNVFSRFRVTGNVFFNNGIGADGFHRNLMFGNESGDHVDNIFRDNVTYYSPSRPGGSNLFASPLGGCRRLTLVGNVFLHAAGRAAEINRCRECEIRGNSFLGRAAEAAALFPDNRFGEVRAFTRLRPNRYERGLAYAVAVNPQGAASVEVDVSALGLPDGAELAVRSVQDLFGDEIRVRVAASTLRIPMEGWSVAAPIGLDEFTAPPTTPEFGVFVLRAVPPAANRIASNSRPAALP